MKIESHYIMLALSLCSIVTLIVLDIMKVELGPDSLSYLRMLADMALGAGLGYSAKALVDKKKAS